MERPPAQGRKAAIREEQEAKILAAAEEVFGQYGLHGATMAMVAERAGVPKPNVHYYFKSKEELYLTLLARVLRTWLAVADTLDAAEEPAAALEAFVRAKLAFSREHPLASKVFANEIINGAPYLLPLLRGELREFVEAKAAVFEQWMAAGKMRRVEPRHLLFLLWAMTQTYADFHDQIVAVLGRRELSDADYAAAIETILTLVLEGLGVRGQSAEPAQRRPR
ncbi:MAG TPA: TetR/AcrR family transcriptional regulator [Candidatus Competibacteraceae bacterium]|nr:TetR/AcrR family transcriptional regulator [Candidatus Competibacteraceae bacterium]